jgi:hypothetical protein
MPLDRGAKPAALDLAVLAQILDDLLGQIRRDREADADVASGRALDRGVDTDHLALEVKGRAAGSARRSA